jgi:hypothetical protein
MVLLPSAGTTRHNLDPVTLEHRSSGAAVEAPRNNAIPANGISEMGEIDTRGFPPTTRAWRQRNPCLHPLHIGPWRPARHLGARLSALSRSRNVRSERPNIVSAIVLLACRRPIWTHRKFLRRARFHLNEATRLTCQEKLAQLQCRLDRQESRGSCVLDPGGRRRSETAPSISTRWREGSFPLSKYVHNDRADALADSSLRRRGDDPVPVLAVRMEWQPTSTLGPSNREIDKSRTPPSPHSLLQPAR